MERDYAYTIGRNGGSASAGMGRGRVRAPHLIPPVAAQASTMKALVIFANEVARQGYFGHLSGRLPAARVYRNHFSAHLAGNKFAGMVNHRRTPASAKGLASSPFDSEGVRTER